MRQTGEVRCHAGMLFAEQLCLRSLSELDQLEAGWTVCVELRSAEAMAAAMATFGGHLHMTLGHLAVAMVISDAEDKDSNEDGLTVLPEAKSWGDRT